MAGIDEASSVVHDVDLETLKAEIAASDTQVLQKPQIIPQKEVTREDLRTYVAVEGDTLSDIADKHNVSADSIRWSNSLVGDWIEVGSELKIPPLDGVVHEIVGEDTLSSLAEEYGVAESEIESFNDIELTGLVAGELIIVPGGEVEEPVFVPSPASVVTYAYSASFGGNTYAPGNCTWHAANRRAAVGVPLPNNLGNAATWSYRASLAGLSVSNTPQQYAAVQINSIGYGHVGFVEEVYEDGSILISEMNYNWRLYALRERVVSAEEAAQYSYIY